MRLLHPGHIQGHLTDTWTFVSWLLVSPLTFPPPPIPTPKDSLYPRLLWRCQLVSYCEQKTLGRVFNNGSCVLTSSLPSELQVFLPCRGRSHKTPILGAGSPSILCSGGMWWVWCRESLGLGRDGASKGAAPHPTEQPSLLSNLLPE